MKALKLINECLDINHPEVKEAIAELEAMQASKTCETCIQVYCPMYLEAVNYSVIESKKEFYCNKHKPKDTL